MYNGPRGLRLHCYLVLALLVTSNFAVRGSDQLDEIRKRGEILWGTDAEGGAPYVYLDPQNPDHLIGFEYELADAIAGKLGVKAKMAQNQWDQLIPALDRGNFDIILSGLEITPEHQQRVAMSRPYFVYAQQIVTRADDTGIMKLEELKGKRVGVLSGSAAEKLLADFKAAEAKVYPGNVESLRDLKARRLDAALMDLPIAL